MTLVHSKRWDYRLEGTIFVSCFEPTLGMQRLIAKLIRFGYFYRGHVMDGVESLSQTA